MSHDLTEVTPDAVAAEAMAFSQRYMAANGPAQPRHLRKQVTMTKAQLEEQKMNEAQGYPSNLSEANRMKSLENQMTAIQGMLSQLADQRSAQPIPVQQQQSAVPTQSSPAPALVASSAPSPKRSVRLSNGQVKELPDREPQSDSTTNFPMSLGETPSDGGEDLWGEGVTVEDVVNDPNAEKVATMCQMVREYLLKKDSLTFFRRANSQIISRHAGYQGWGPQLKAQFTQRFKETLTDPVFLKNIVEKVLSMEMGYALAPQKVAEMAVMAAGWISFALAGI